MKGEKIFYTASGLAIPESAVIELDSDNLVTVWNWKRIEKIYIIWKGNKWAVRKHRSKRALKLFKHRELAFKHACDVVYKLESLRGMDRYRHSIIISVHNKDGSVDFQYDAIRDKIL